MSRLSRHSVVRGSTAVAVGALLVSPLAVATAASAAPSGDALVISEVYGGGGNSGATLTHDFIELFNPTDSPIAVDGLSVQYRSKGGTGTGVTALDGSVPAGGHYLVQQARGAGGSEPLPTPNATGTLAMSGSSGIVVLAEGTEPIALAPGDSSGGPGIIDLVGYGSGATVFESGPTGVDLTSTTSAQRSVDGVDSDDNAADFTVAAPTPAAAPMTDTPAPEEPVSATIPEIQGPGGTTPLKGTTVTTRGLVTAAYPSGGLFGFYIQVPGSGATDLDLSAQSASQALFVYQAKGSGGVSVRPGDVVEVTGEAGEYAGATQVTVAAADDITTLADAAEPVVATSTWPETPQERELLEGMLYRPTGNFTVTETYATMNYGEVGLARGDQPLLQPTQVARPGTEAASQVEADNAQRGIVLDDGSSTSFAGKGDLTPAYVSTTEPVRVGAAATFTRDVIFTQGGSPSSPTYRFQPLVPVVGPENVASPASFADTRTAAPDADRINAGGAADLRVASFNVLNYFTTLGDPDDDNIGDGGCTAYNDRAGDGNNVRSGCELRGAWDPSDLARQQAKIVAAITALDADVVGLMEIENSAALGEEADEATRTLVAALNAAAGATVWAANPSSSDLPPVAEQDVITNAIIYKVDSVERAGEALALGDQSSTGEAFANAREPIAQVFTPKAGGEPFLFVVNHFKSKGSAGPNPGDEDTGDGQGSSNGSRVLQATALRDWVPSVQANTGVESVLLAGDFNSYAMEDPMQVLREAGYTNVEEQFALEDHSYSYSGLSGSLDHVLANDAAVQRATGADIWSINAGESVALEYSRWNYWATDFHEDGPFRSSDHDPVVLGLTASAQESAVASLNLLAINDFHGRINKDTVNWAGTIEELTRSSGAENTLFLSSGDNIGATEFASSVAGDQPTIDVLNALGLDASAVGNHEFDGGYADLTDRVIGAEGNENAQWAYLGANVYHAGTQDPALQEFELLTVDGIDVAVIGAVTQETASLVSKGGIADLEFGDPVAAVNRVAARLSDGDDANGEADVLVASFHEGATAGADSSTYAEEVARGNAFSEMAAVDPSVDVILNAHTHKVYAWDAPVPGVEGAFRPIVQGGEYGEGIAQVQLEVDRATGDVLSHDATIVAPTDTDDATLVAEFPRVAQVKEIVDAALAHAAEIGNEPVGEVTADITTAFKDSQRDDRLSESTLGDLVGNALRDGLPDGVHADLGVTNPGGLRAELLHAGDTTLNPLNTDGVVTFAEANAVLPFLNNISLVELTGADLIAVLEQQWQPETSSRPFLALGLSDNVRVTQDPSLPRGERITSVVIDGERVDPATVYTVSTFSFLASGGDNFEAFTRGAATDTGLLDRDLWMAYLQEASPLSPDFARQQVTAPGMPAVVTAGEAVSFELHQLDLTSLGSPTNTEVAVELSNGNDNVAVGTFAVTEGSALIEFTAPAGLDGDWTVSAVASPSGTTIGLPAAPELRESRTKVRLDRHAVRAGEDRVTVTATVTGQEEMAPEESAQEETAPEETAQEETVEDEMPSEHVPTGFVGVYLDDTLVGTAPLRDGVAQLVIGPFDTPATHTVRVVYMGDEETRQSMQEKRFRVLEAKRAHARG